MRAVAAAGMVAVGLAQVLLAAMLISACGAKPPEPLPAVPEKPHRFVTQLPTHPGPGLGVPVAIPRPVLAITESRPDLSEEPRWPLSMMEHPALEPRFNVAGALADPGITWTELCARGVHHRHDPSRMDELDYLGGWCAAEQHDLKTALTTLAPLMRSAVPGIANGTPLDMVDVLVANEDAEHATKDLADLQLRDAHLWDLLAAAYFEIGKNDDALQATSTAMQLDPTAKPATRCHRIARELLLGPQGVRQPLFDQLAAMTRDPKHVDPTCEYLAAALPCAIRSNCYKYYANQNLHGDDVYVANLYDRWDTPRDWSGWIDYAWDAVRLFDATGAHELTLAAIDASVISGDCTDASLADLVVAVDAMKAEIKAKSRTGAIWFEPKAAWVHSLADEHARCATFVANWHRAHPP